MKIFTLAFFKQALDISAKAAFAAFVASTSATHWSPTLTGLKIAGIGAATVFVITLFQQYNVVQAVNTAQGKAAAAPPAE